MKMEDFKWILDYLESSNEESVRLIGGEPTLHPEFTDFLLEALRRPSLQRLVIFTNGIFSERKAYLFELASRQKPVHLTINVNHPSVIGRHFKTIEKNLGLLKGKCMITLGINFYQENQDYVPVLELAQQYGIQKVRYAIAVPNASEKVEPVKYFSRFVPVLSSFAADIARLGLDATADCNNIPLCLLDDDTLRMIAMVRESCLKKSTCSAVLDVKPDMSVIRCFGLGDLSVNIKDFSNIAQLNAYFVEKLDRNIKAKTLFESCKDCASYQVSHESCGCLNMRG
jgi:sulfatase maturation enzyme AslB (radical SAM superfamily)